MSFRLYTASAALLAAVICAAPRAVADEVVSQAFASAGGMVDAAAACSHNAALGVLYQRLFDFRDKKIIKQRQIELYRTQYRRNMDFLKTKFPDVSEEEILKAALEGPNLVDGYSELANWYGELSSALRSIAEIDVEIAFVEEKIDQYLNRAPKKS